MAFGEQEEAAAAAEVHVDEDRQDLNSLTHAMTKLGKGRILAEMEQRSLAEEAVGMMKVGQAMRVIRADILVLAAALAVVVEEEGVLTSVLADVHCEV